MASTTPATQAVDASARVHNLLARLHAESAAQENSLWQSFFYFTRLMRFYISGATWSASADDHMREKFVALDADKCQLMYLLARSIGARNIVEAGTSFGVSTMYLALAVGQNVGDLKATGQSVSGRVIATEKEPSKAERARKYWEEAGDEVEPWIETRVGNLLETLKAEGMPDEIDMLLLDSEYRSTFSLGPGLTLHLKVWTPLALPTLDLIRPRLRRGALVLTDNTVMAKPLYKELLDYLYDQKNGFKTTTAPYTGGFEVSVYLPGEGE